MSRTLGMKPRSAARSPEAGYTLLLALFVAALMLIGASVAVPNLIIQGRRQREKLLIWRGQQYARAIGLFYRKTGHYPHNIEELAKGVAGIHFLRRKYKDPMNTADGSWRLIYLGPGGQLIGSLRWHTLAEYQAAQMGLKLPGTTTGTGTNGGTGKDAAKTPAKESTEGAGTSQQPAKPPAPLPTRIINEGDMVGGNLIGVASKVNAKSVKVFMGREKYREWEFLWNPLQGAKGVTTPGKAPATGKKPGPGTPKPPAPPTPKPPETPNPQFRP
jgi:type II secretory pathway pseudopilin PulG